MVADFRRRFWVSLALTLPFLALAPLIQCFLGIEGALAFPGDSYVQALLATAIYFYGGWPFLKGFVREIGDRKPGMMTLIALAISVAYVYSAAVVIGLSGEVFFWELATLIDIMLLGHWIEMRSVMGASRALEKLVELLPAEAHLLRDDGSTEDVPVTEIEPGDRVLVKPSEKVPVDGVIVEGRAHEQGLAVESDRVDELAGEGKTVVYVLVDDEVRGAIALADIIREESHEALRRLKEMGIQVMMLTGDAEAVARWVADELGLDDYFAEVLPDQKAEVIKEVKARGLAVAMTGDGVNDAPALVEADVGIAIGAGTDVAVESADIVLVRSDPRDVTSLVELARATYRKMVQNLWWATGYNVVAIPLAAGVLYGVGIVLSPAAGAVLMSLSTVIVAFNARLLGRSD
ncbi:MAG: HAD-IC family P-type ATPase [Gemmatimonadales bacterium]|jgi:cation transport ATPase